MVVDSHSTSSINFVCWSCLRQYSMYARLCSQCRVVQGPLPQNAFQLLEIEMSYALDCAQLQANYLRLSQVLHPDRFVLKSPVEKLYAQQHCASLNSAYGVLQDPVKRAQEMLLALHKPMDLGSTSHNVELLLEIMELQEAVASANILETQAIHQNVLQKITALIQNIDALFKKNQFEFVGDDIVRLQYLTKLRDICNVKIRRE